MVIAPREVEVYSLEITRYAYPELDLRIECGSGTYVRSLGRDLALSVGTGAVMQQLTRTAIGEFAVADAIGVDGLSLEAIEGVLAPPVAAVQHLPKLQLTEGQVGQLKFGQKLTIEDYPAAPEFAGIDREGRLIAVLAEREPGLLASTCNIAQSL